jgi:hypothetical protein
MPINVGGNIISSSSLTSDGNFTNSIVTSGLICHLDASNKNSYIGNGTSWIDLSGNGNNGTLLNGVGFTTDSGGGLTLNGSNQYITIPQTGINFNTSTLIYVAKLDVSPNTRNTIFSQYYGGNGAQMEWGSDGSLRSNYRQNTASTPENDAPNGGSQISTNTMYSIAVTYTAGRITHFKNANNLGSSLNSSQTDINGGSLITIGQNSSAGLYFKGNVYCVMIYNKVLSNIEIIRNHYSIKNRYGF